MNKTLAARRVLPLAVAASGGILGSVGAFFQEVTRGSLLTAFVAGPMIEEAMKPSGVYFLLVKRPRLLSSRLFTAVLSAAGGFSFALVENVVYLQVYFPDHTAEMAAFRYTVDVALHTLTSFIFGFGINQNLLASVRGEIPFLQGNKRYFILPIIIHSAFNITVSVLSWRGVLP